MCEAQAVSLDTSTELNAMHQCSCIHARVAVMTHILLCCCHRKPRSLGVVHLAHCTADVAETDYLCATRKIVHQALRKLRRMRSQKHKGEAPHMRCLGHPTGL